MFHFLSKHWDWLSLTQKLFFLEHGSFLLTLSRNGKAYLPDYSYGIFDPAFQLTNEYMKARGEIEGEESMLGFFEDEDEYESKLRSVPQFTLNLPVVPYKEKSLAEESIKLLNRILAELDQALDE